jgi:hypothetical protein
MRFLFTASKKSSIYSYFLSECAHVNAAFYFIFSCTLATVIVLRIV